MSEEFKNIIKIASIYLATVIGAGFASGQEILQFFCTYYHGGFYGILLAGLLFSALGCFVLIKVYKERIRNFDEFIFPLLGWRAGWFVDIASTLFMFCQFCIMIAGAGNVLVEKLGIPMLLSIIIISALCMVFILTSIRGVVMLSTFLTPVLIAGMLAVGFYIVFFKDVSVFNAAKYFNAITNNWFFSSLLYVSYNSLMSIIVMCNLLPYLKTKKTAAAGGALGGIMLFLVAFVMNTAVSLHYPGYAVSELPLLNILTKYSDVISGFYAVVLCLAMFLHAVNAGYCFVDRTCSRFKVNSFLVTLVLCALAVPLAMFKFSNLIAAIYPVFGYIGLFLILVIFLQGLHVLPSKLPGKSRRSHCKNH